MKCGPRVRPVKEGSPGCFSSPCRGSGALHLTLCFNANDSFISPVLLTCATWPGSLRNPFCHYGYWADRSAPWQEWRFTAVCLTAPSVRGRVPRGVPPPPPHPHPPHNKNKTPQAQFGPFCRWLLSFPCKPPERRRRVDKMEQSSSGNITSRRDSCIQMFTFLVGGGLISPLKLATEQPLSWCVRAGRKRFFPRSERRLTSPRLRLSSHGPRCREKLPRTHKTPG